MNKAKTIREIDIAEAEKMAARLHAEGFHCTETILRTLWAFLLPKKELSRDIARMTEVLHGGIAETMSSHCGALTIGILMIGLIYGRENLNGDDHLASAISRGYWRKMLDEFGTSHCTTLRSDQTLTGEAPTRCGCIIVRAVRLFLAYMKEINNHQISYEEMILWDVDRTNEPCHEKVMPVKSSIRCSAEEKARSRIAMGQLRYIEPFMLE